MALESQIARIQAAMTDVYCQGYDAVLTPTKKLSYIRAALEFDLPEHVSELFAVLDKSWSFREMDAGDFRLLTNATLDDALHPTVVGEKAIVETVAQDLAGNQAALLTVTVDAETGANVKYDVCLDADSDDSDTGSFLTEDEGVTLTVGTEVQVDVYPCAKLVLRLTLDSDHQVRALRLRMAYAGRGALQKYTHVIAMFASAYFFDGRAEDLRRLRNDPEVIRNFESRAAALRKRAVGQLTGQGSTTKNVGAVVGAASANGYVNAAYERFREQTGN